MRLLIDLFSAYSLNSFFRLNLNYCLSLRRLIDLDNFLNKFLSLRRLISPRHLTSLRPLREEFDQLLVVIPLLFEVLILEPFCYQFFLTFAQELTTFEKVA